MATEREFWGRPLDTSTLGPVRVDPDGIAARARIVREAIDLIITEGDDPFMVKAAWDAVKCGATDATLAKLGRLLK